MAKKKQPDFQPTKLRVGKHLPKGRNVTNTSFKSKKIVTKDQKLKTSADNASLTDLIRLTHHTNVSVKTDALKKIEKYIQMNDSALSTYFAEVLTTTGKLFLDFHPKVRQEALNIIKTSSDFLSESQMSSFMNVLISHLHCMMTHINLQIRKDSLDLLGFLLKSHPNLICHSTKILNNLLNMISSVKAQRGDSSFNQKKRKLDDNISTTITSVEWRDQVMKLIGEFLEKLVETYTKRKLPCEDEQKVHYDGKTPLFVQLYAGGGLTPAKLELPSDMLRSKSNVTEELKSFFGDLVSVASDIVTEEIAGLNISIDNNTLRPDNVEHLNTVTRVLCCIADWYNMESQIEDKNFISMMNCILRNKLMKGFCYKMHESTSKKGGRRNKEMSCVHLNLGIGSLYCSFILGTEFENAVLEQRVLWLVTDILNKEQYQEVKTVSLILNIIKSFLVVVSNCIGEERKKYNEEFLAIFEHLCQVANMPKDKVLTKEIQSFFIKLSLDYDYKFLLDCNVLDSWTHYALSQMKRMNAEKKTDKALLKCINLMCCREYPSFIDDLNKSNASEIVGFLKLGDEDYQLTVINLITHMTNLPPDFLQTVAELILVDQHLSLKIITKLIRSLFNRFVDQRVSEEEFKEFSRFLLNVSFDMVSVEKAMSKYTEGDYFEGNEEEGEEYSNELLQLLFYVQSGNHYTILPSQQWERHSNILEVCLECLVVHPNRDLTMEVATAFFAELLSSKWIFPVHSAIALLKLAHDVYFFDDFILPQEHVLMFSDELMCSSLYYISVVTHKENQERCKSLGIAGLQDILGLDREKARNLSQLMVARMFEQGLAEVTLLHILRIIKFLRVKNKISLNDMVEFREVFRAVEMYCADDSQQRAILFQIYELLHEQSS